MPGLVIGKVAIKVLPDTDGFREKVKRDLNGKEKPGQVRVKVIPELDDTAFRNIQRQLAGLSDIDVQVTPELDRSAMGQVELALEGIDQVDVDIDPKLDWEKYTRALAALEEFSEPRPVEVGVWANMRSIRTTAARLAALTRDRVVDIKTQLDEPTTQRTVKLLGDAFSRISGLRYTLESFAKFREEMLNLDRMLPKIGLFANGLGSLSAIALTAGGSLLSVSAGLVQMTAAGLAVPGILGGIATGLAVTAIALADFKQEVPQITAAWEDLRSSISQNFWDVAGDGIRSLVDELFPLLTTEAGKTASAVGTFFENLTGSLQTRLLPAMSGMFDDLNASILIFAQRTDAVANIITILGTLGAQYLPRLAMWFGDLTQRFSDFLTAADEAGKLTEWVESGITQIKNLGRALGATVSIFASLAEAAERAGGATLGSVADSLERVARAASSPGFQRGLTDTLSAAYEMMDQISSRVGPSLANLIESLSETFQEMAPVMGDTVATAVTAIADALASPALQKGLSHLLSGFNRMVNELAPAMTPLAEKLGALGSVVGELAEAVGSILGQAIITVSPLFVTLAEALLPVIDGLGELLSGALKELQPVFSALATTIREEVAPELPKMTEKLQELWDKISPALIPALQLLAENIGPLLVAAIETFSSAINIAIALVDTVTAAVNLCKDAVALFTGAWTAASEWITSAVEAIKTKISTGWESIKSNTAAKWNQIKSDVIGKAAQIRSEVIGAVENLRANMSQKWDSVKSAASAKWSQLKSDVIGKAAQLRSEVVGAIENLRANASAKWESIRSNASAKWESIKNTIGDAAGRIKSAVSSKVDDVVSYMRGVPGRIKGALGDLGSLLFNAGVSIISGLIGGIVSKAGDLVSTLSWVTSLIPENKGPIEKDRKLLTPAGIAIVQGLIKGIESEETALIRTLHDLSDSIVDTLGTDVAMTVSADAAVATADVARHITSATRSTTTSDTSTPAEAPLQIGNITIPLEDLKQLKDLEDFMDLLRVRSRMG